MLGCLTLMAEADVKLECLLTQCSDRSLHLFRDFHYRCFRFRVGFKPATVGFRPTRALGFSGSCHVTVLYFQTRMGSTKKLI